MLHLGDPSALRRLRRDLRDSAMAFEGVHAPVDRLYGLWWDLSGPTRVRRRTLEVRSRLLDALAYLEGSHLVVHPGRWGFPEDECAARLGRPLASLEVLTRRGREAGVQVCVEKGFGILNRPLLGLATGPTTPGLGFCLDTGHALVADGDPCNLADLLAGRIATLHLHDNHGGQDEHLIPGDGIIDRSRLVPWLVARGYRGNLMLEAFPFRYPRGIDAWLSRCRVAAERLRSYAGPPP